MKEGHTKKYYKTHNKRNVCWKEKSIKYKTIIPCRDKKIYKKKDKC